MLRSCGHVALRKPIHTNFRQTAKMRYYRYIWQQSKPNTQIYTVATVDWNEEEKYGFKKRIFKHYTTFYTNVKSNSKERTRNKMKKNWNRRVVDSAVFSTLGYSKSYLIMQSLQNLCPQVLWSRGSWISKWQITHLSSFNSSAAEKNSRVLKDIFLCESIS